MAASPAKSGLSQQISSASPAAAATAPSTAAKDLHESDSGNLLGALTLSLDGKVIQASGDLDTDSEAIAQTVFAAMQNTHSLIHAKGGPDPLKRVVVKFASYSFIMSVVNGEILVAKLAH